MLNDVDLAISRAMLFTGQTMSRPRCFDSHFQKPRGRKTYPGSCVKMDTSSIIVGQKAPTGKNSRLRISIFGT